MNLMLQSCFVERGGWPLGFTCYLLFFPSSAILGSHASYCIIVLVTIVVTSLVVKMDPICGSQ